jgi:Berberine and berberine like
MWQQPTDDERLIAASRASCEAMRPVSTGGAYLNFTPEDRARDAYGTKKYERVVALKGRYDPEKLFRLNQNIKPTRGAGQAALA